MNSSHESFTISNQESLLLHNDQKQKQTRIKNLKTIIFFNLLILFIIISISMTLQSIFEKKRRPEQVDDYISGSSRYYCHLTPYPEPCYSSMSSIINTTALEHSPGPIFTASLQVAINELNNTTLSISKALSNPTNNNTLVGSKLFQCQTLLQDSLSRLNKSLGLLGVDSDIQTLTYMEMDEFRALIIAAADDVGKCFLALEEIGDIEKMGVEEVNLGVVKANMFIANTILLFEGRESILFDFYNPLIGNGDYYENDYYFCDFEYRFLACLYSAMYLFLALLYFLFWNCD